MSLDWPNLIAGAAIAIVMAVLRVFLLRLWHSITDKKLSYDRNDLKAIVDKHDPRSKKATGK
jgi:hypothetical protein